MADVLEIENLMRAPWARMSPPESARRLAAELNRRGGVVTLDRAAFAEALRSKTQEAAFAEEIFASRPHLVSNVSAFLARNDIEDMLATVRAIEAAARLSGFQAAAFGEQAPPPDHGPVGVFMGYDFHLTPAGPKLVEVNTNAGGAFINAFIGRAQRACCPLIENRIGAAGWENFEAQAFAMFESEWRRQRASGAPARIAIVDDNPREQYLFPEFVLARRFFEHQGVDAVILDAGELGFAGDRLIANGRKIDLVYNRLVDFSLAEPRHAALRAAYESGAAVVTPNPRNHALLADKRNLILLSDAERMRGFGLDSAHVEALGAVPRTLPVTEENAADLWSRRKEFFFKPAGGHGAKAVYRGDKLTKGVWAEILSGGYVAQEIVPPGERRIDMDGAEQTLKMDVRLYTYDGRLLIAAARLYQGQTTNFRTTGGGFAPVFLV